MTKINLGVTANPILEWAQKNQVHIKTHSAWQDPISESESEALLNNKSPFTYLLRSGEKDHSYFISFVREDRSIKHQFFVLELDLKGWYYRNGSTLNSPVEIISKNLNELIPQMMHCDPSSCTPLTSQNGAAR